MPGTLYTNLGVLILFVLILILYLTLIYPLYVSPLRHIPGPPLFISPSSENPFSYLLALIKGQYPGILYGEPGAPQHEWLKKYGGENGIIKVVGPFGFERVMFVSPQAWKKVLVNEYADYPKPQAVRQLFNMVTGRNGLLASEGDDHHNMRREIRTAFTLPELISRMDRIYGIAESLCRAISEHTIGTIPSKIPIYELTSRAGIDLTCAVGLSFYPNTLHNPKSRLGTAFDSLTKLESISHVSWMLWLSRLVPQFDSLIMSDFVWKNRRWLTATPVLGRFRFDLAISAMHDIREVAKEIMEGRHKERQVQSVERQGTRDLVRVLLNIQDTRGNEHGSRCDESLTEHIVTILDAGSVLAGAGLSWTLYFLAANKAAQDRLRKEIAPVFINNIKPDHQTLQTLSWLECVVMESLRILPPQPRVFREAAKTDYIDGYLVPKGTFIYIPIRVVNTWEPFWGTDAHEYRPERWLDMDRDKIAKSFATFSMGPRSCVGRTTVILELKIMIASLIANFEFDLAYKGQVADPTAGIGMIPAEGMPLLVRRI